MPTIYPLIMGCRAILATEHYLSAAAGARMFACGGNAIDAAIAATFVEGVVNPHMHTIGGEAPMLIYSASARRVVAINGTVAMCCAMVAKLRADGNPWTPRLTADRSTASSSGRNRSPFWVLSTAPTHR